MEKAYDLKELGKKLESNGLPLLKDCAEETAKTVYACVKDWLKESAAKSENKIDDVAVTFVDQLDKLILPTIDKIDGEAN